jgi:hypothetical protein
MFSHSPQLPGSLKKHERRLHRLNEDLEEAKRLRRRARERNYEATVALKGLQGSLTPVPLPQHTPSPTLVQSRRPASSSPSSTPSSASSEGDLIVAGEQSDTEVEFRSHGNSRHARLGSVLVQPPPAPPTPPSSASILQKLHFDELAISGSSTPNLARTIRTSPLNIPPTSPPMTIDISIRHKPYSPHTKAIKGRSDLDLVQVSTNSLYDLRILSDNPNEFSNHKTVLKNVELGKDAREMLEQFRESRRMRLSNDTPRSSLARASLPQSLLASQSHPQPLPDPPVDNSPYCSPYVRNDGGGSADERYSDALRSSQRQSPYLFEPAAADGKEDEVRE